MDDPLILTAIGLGILGIVTWVFAFRSETSVKDLLKNSMPVRVEIMKTETLMKGGGSDSSPTKHYYWKVSRPEQIISERIEVPDSDYQVY